MSWSFLTLFWRLGRTKRQWVNSDSVAVVSEFFWWPWVMLDSRDVKTHEREIIVHHCSRLQCTFFSFVFFCKWVQHRAFEWLVFGFPSSRHITLLLLWFFRNFDYFCRFTILRVYMFNSIKFDGLRTIAWLVLGLLVCDLELDLRLAKQELCPFSPHCGQGEQGQCYNKSELSFSLYLNEPTVSNPSPPWFCSCRFYWAQVFGQEPLLFFFSVWSGNKMTR